GRGEALKSTGPSGDVRSMRQWRVQSSLDEEDFLVLPQARLARLWRPGWPDRLDASASRRTREVARRGRIRPRAQLLSRASRARGAPTGHLHRLEEARVSR